MRAPLVTGPEVAKLLLGVVSTTIITFLMGSTPVFETLLLFLKYGSPMGDKTAIELFVAGVRCWGSWRWRQLENSQST
jgi:hypothetical protein